MVDIPNSAKSRLRQGSGGTSAHPDANLLAAFSEQALAGTEREQVLAHLAQCADCREIVALSAPEAAPPQTAYVPRGWFGMRPEFMRWAVVGASAVVVVAAVLLVRPELERAPVQSVQQARNEAPLGPQSAESVATEAADALQPKKDSAKDLVVTGARRERQVMKIEGANTPARLTAGLSAPTVAPAAPPPPPASIKPEEEFRYAAAPAAGQAAGSATGGVSGAKVAAEPKRDVKVGDLAVLDSAPANTMAVNESQAQPTALAKEMDAGRTDAFADVVTKKNEPAVAELKAQRAPADTASGRMTMRATSNVATRTWRIAEGKLESSRDGGKTWMGISLPAGVKPLTVAGIFPRVWVGGDDGVLLRSDDNGATWTRVPGDWQGNVIFIKFEDAKRGELKTSRPGETQIWATEDGGATWTLRARVG